MKELEKRFCIEMDDNAVQMLQPFKNHNQSHSNKFSPKFLIKVTSA